MKKLLLLNLAITFTTLMNAQAKAPEYTDLMIKLSTEPGFWRFTPAQRIVWPLQKKPEVKAVPDNIIEFVVRQIDFQQYNTLYKSLLGGAITKDNFDKYINTYFWNRSLFTNLDYNHILYVLIGKISENEMIIVLDKNNNLSFADDEKFFFPILKSKEEEKIALQNNVITNVTFDFFNGTKVAKKTVPMRINPYKGSLEINMNADSIEKKYYLGIGIPTYKTGKVSINKKKYNIYLSNGFTALDFNQGNTELLIEKSDNIMTDQTTKEIPYRVGDVITIDSLQYEFKNVSTFGDTIGLKFIGINKFPEGFKEGSYLPKMKATTISRQEFDFKEYRGKYLLLDFWGTWCIPCIKLIPQIKELKQKFNGRNFVMVSVAFDENEERVKQFIADNKMDWINLIQNKNSNDIIKKLKISVYPTMIIIDPSGKIISRDKKIEEVEKLLNEKLF